MKFLSKSLLETGRIASDFVDTLNIKNKAVVVALEGDLGSGKTAFAQEVGKILGVAENMHSPTFVIMKVYSIDFKGWKKFIHIDAYRLEKEIELVHLGWQDLVKDKENLILIEWPERVPMLIPLSTERLGFKFVDQSTREIEIYEKED